MRTCLICACGPLSEQSYVLFRRAHFCFVMRVPASILLWCLGEHEVLTAAVHSQTVVLESAQQLWEHRALHHARGVLIDVHDARRMDPGCRWHGSRLKMLIATQMLLQLTLLTCFWPRTPCLVSCIMFAQHSIFERLMSSHIVGIDCTTRQYCFVMLS